MADLLQHDFPQLLTFDITGQDILVKLFLALICGFIIAAVYRFVHRFPRYSLNFVNSLVLLTLLITIIMMVIGNNLARACGLVGAMSIIRFRTPIKETQDTVFLFFALTIGVAVGVGYHKLAIVITIIISMMLLWLFRSGISTTPKREYLLHVVYTGNEEKPFFLEVVREYSQEHHIVNVCSQRDDFQLELSYHLVLKDDQMEKDFLHNLRDLDDVKQVNLYFDETPI